METYDPKLILKIDEDPLLAESDRGCVLLLTSDLDNSITQLLTIWFKYLGKTSNKLNRIIFDYTGPLGTFSNKIYLSKALGIIDDNLYKDLLIIRKIRNLAAHSNQSFSLSDEIIKSKIINVTHLSKNFKKMKRYNPVNMQEYEDSSKKINENFMKGLGYLRADKVNFILTVKNILLKLYTTRIVCLKNLQELMDVFDRINEENKLLNDKLE